ncbi:MAG TPA: hypothetical protein VF902_04750 [Coriobacteriia bacterium]
MAGKTAGPGKPGAQPGIVTLPDITVAFVHTSGDPSELGPDVMKALYGAGYALKFALKKRGVEMKMDMPRARWDWTPGEGDADQATTGALAGDWALAVPDGTTEAYLVQKDPRFPVRIARWSYGECAWIMHLGGYDEELPTIERLVAFIADSGRVVAGKHEEWYMSGPNAKVPKTVILYPVRAKA